jgi:hypothetical protein
MENIELIEKDQKTSEILNKLKISNIVWGMIRISGHRGIFKVILPKSFVLQRSDFSQVQYIAEYRLNPRSYAS